MDGLNFKEVDIKAALEDFEDKGYAGTVGIIKQKQDGFMPYALHWDIPRCLTKGEVRKQQIFILESVVLDCMTMIGFLKKTKED